MSRQYQMSIQCHYVPIDKKVAIREAVYNNCNVDLDYSCLHGDNWVYMEGTNELSLGGGKTEEEYADQVKETVWKAAKTSVEIIVTAVYLEDLPFEEYCFDEEDYDKWLETTSDPEEKEDGQ